jgi:histone-lysine N-methyltransferase SETMAR
MDSKVEYRSLLLRHFRSGHSVGLAQRDLQELMGDEAPSYPTCKRWYAKFKTGDFSLEDMEKPGRPHSNKEGAVLQAIKQQPKQSTRDLEKATGASRSTVRRILNRAGLEPKKPHVIPHALTPEQLKKRVDVCQSLVHSSSTTNWVKWVVAEDEKWISYDNPDMKMEWLPHGEQPQPVAKRDPHCKKDLLSFFFCSDGCVYYEILEERQTVNSSIFCNQLEEMERRVPLSHVRHGKIDLLMDNARPHYATATRNKLEELHINWLPHPPYSPDLSPCDYHVFRSLQDFCKGKQFKKREDVEAAIEDWLKTRPAGFWKDGLEQLPGRWRDVIASGGKYLDR